MSEEPKITLTDGSPVTDDHREIITGGVRTGQQKGYVVLSEAERAKGFVRPVRLSYRHVGRPICGKYGENKKEILGGMVYVCVNVPGHEGPCTTFRGLPQPEAAKAHRQQSLGGCGTVTEMGVSIAETYARDPKFYSGTFCCGCFKHPPVGEHGEFVWEGTDERVGT